MPLGQTKGKWNYNLDEKRVLNFENVVNDDDNIKQDLSIGVSLPPHTRVPLHATGFADNLCSFPFVNSMLAGQTCPHIDRVRVA